MAKLLFLRSYLNVYNVNVIIIDIPSVYVDATDIIIEYGLNVTLNCNVTSFPVHTSVYWQRISNSTTTNMTSGQAGIDDISNVLPSLTILMIKSADSGLYTCFAVNIVGTGHSDVVNLTVIGGKIKHYQFPSTIVSKCSTVCVWSQLSCA